jgi:peptidoglycan/LPS O-acetylase OafA/YrhL
MPPNNLAPVERREFHIPSLNGLRAIAAMLVFVGHAGLGNVIPGGLGVTIFFFLSGYLITTLLRMEYEASKTISLKKFYLRRAYRILPPLYLTLIAAAALPPHSPDGVAVGAVFAQITQLTNYYIIMFTDAHIVRATGATWSLAIEEHFYLLYPLGLIGLLRSGSYKTAARVLIGICALVLLWRCMLIYLFHVSHDYTYLATDTRADSLLYGCILGLWLNPMLDRQPVLSERHWAGLVLAAGVLMLSTLLYRNEDFRETFRYSLQGIALFPMFFCAVRYHGWFIFRWLQWSWISGFGVLTYTFYLFHGKALELAALFLGNLVTRGCLAFLIALAFSGAMYLLIERHLARVRRHLHG